MWFCEMRQVPRLRDCASEFASQLLVRARDLFTTLKDRWADRARGRVELIAPAAARPRRPEWVRPVA
jgi:hypothetical protein